MRSFNSYPISGEHAGMTVEAYLKQVLNYSGRKIQKLTRQNGITLNGKRVYLQKKVKAKDILKVLTLEDKDYGVQPEKGPVEILYENNELMVLNKPAFLLVHPAGQTYGGTLANFLAYNLKQKGQVSTIRPIHRLDRDTSGCIMFAKSAQSQSALEQQLQSGSIERIYRALVQGKVTPPEGTIDEPIGSHPKLPNRRAVTSQGDHAITHYQTIETFGEVSLLELTLETGRTHQIRVHLTHIGCPIIGDRMYGTGSDLMKRQALHAYSISFRDLHSADDIIVEAPLPDDFAEAIKKLRS